MTELAANLRRLMARDGLTIDDVVARAGLDARTVRGILGGSAKPHARTLHQLATGLSVSVDELFQSPGLLAHRLFDRRTNPLVDDAVAQRPELFADWTAVEFDELYSRFGTGGELTFDGAVRAAEAMNRRRAVHEKVALVLETGEAELLAQFVDLLYARIVNHGPPLAGANRPRSA